MLVALVNPATQAIIMVGLVPLSFPPQSRPIGFRFADRIWITTGGLTATSPPRYIYVVADLPKLEFIEDIGDVPETPSVLLYGPSIEPTQQVATIGTSLVKTVVRSDKVTFLSKLLSGMLT